MRITTLGSIFAHPELWIGFLLLFVGLFFVVLSYVVEAVFSRISGADQRGNLAAIKHKESIRVLRKLFIIGFGIVGMGWIVWVGVRGTMYQAHVLEWLNLIVRWAHVIFGVAWIGTSFYFIFLENALERRDDLPRGLAGTLWAIHGGGFYHVEKFKVAPPALPKKLHWFKWEAYMTWISGISLLAVVYYFDASSLLIDPEIRELTEMQGVLLSIGSLIVSWFIYDLLCKSPLVEKRALFFFIIFAYLCFASWFFTEMFSPRAAYIHVGAVIGTMMAGNVFRVIIPSQKAMVNAAEKGLRLDPELGRHAGIRSLHNNYFTLPVLFIMISNHFPSTYGNEWNWIVLSGLVLSSAAVKHWFNLRDQGRKNPWIIPAASLGILAIALMTAPRESSSESAVEIKGEELYYRAYQVMTLRCSPCHSAHPTDEVNIVAPNGIMFDTPAQMVAQKDRIMQRAVITKTMPQANKSGMSDGEREILRRWIEDGAQTDF